MNIYLNEQMFYSSTVDKYIKANKHELLFKINLIDKLIQFEKC